LIINEYDATTLHRAFGIDMGSMELGPIEERGVGGGWGRVAPGRQSDAHQHDEIETFVIVTGSGDLIVNSERRPVVPGTVIQFEPFETHHLVNTGRRAPRCGPGGGRSTAGRCSCSPPPPRRTATCTSGTCPGRIWVLTCSSGSSG
jgi:uncharacterized cupin superfamily protein